MKFFFVKKPKALPLVPALAVLPILCTQSSIWKGMSQLITVLISLTSVQRIKSVRIELTNNRILTQSSRSYISCDQNIADAIFKISYHLISFLPILIVYSLPISSYLHELPSLCASHRTSVSSLGHQLPSLFHKRLVSLIRH